MEYLIAADLEGIHGVVGEPDKTLTDSSDYTAAVEGAILEINTVVAALFDNGAARVAVWDNHGSGKNIDFSKIDPRAERIDTTGDKYRFDFVKNYDFKGIIYLGYHAKEGTFGGVLAHTYNSKSLQYVKLNGESVGELTIDSYICETHGITPIFAAADDIALAEIKGLYPDIVTVTTKYGKSRNSAELRDRAEVLHEIRHKVVSGAVRKTPTLAKPFLSPSKLEIRYTRAEKAASAFERAKAMKIPVSYGEDTHTLFYEITFPQQIIKVL